MNIGGPQHVEYATAPAQLAILVGDAGFLVLQPALECSYRRCAVIRVEEVEGQKPEALLRRDPENVFGLVVDEQEPPLAVDDGDQIIGPFDDLPVLLLAVSEGFLDPHSIGNITKEAEK